MKENSEQPPENAKDENVRETLKEIGRLIDEQLPQGWGFMLFSFPFGDVLGRVNYVSNAQREDAVKTIKDWLSHADKDYGRHS